MGGDANDNYCSFMAVTIHLRQLLFIRVDCIVSFSQKPSKNMETEKKKKSRKYKSLQIQRV